MKNGIASLPMVLLIGGLLAGIAISGIFIAYYLSQSGLGEKLSDEALAAAQSGIEDAAIRIVRDKNFNPSPNPYTLTVGSRTAQITVCKNSCAGTNTFQINSLGTALNKQRQIQAIFYVNDTTGKVDLQSEKEKAIQ